ncbi:triose-phosphate isomerase family protein [Desulfitobacterium sp.]|uniref:triose-phosphate isomerase family protein n=1 Tax=Desulfitobacterium sp. TaxID=49981 RepID=UPI002B20A27D|nr:triose-phosphate isomerase family protein [Desulfitobacterium sp.]MEA4900671.1 triose-phosphate isomerase family protein [Desulfitobacterium sp.]
MKEIFINLKRFDVPRSKGGVCPRDNAKEWIEEVISESMKLGIGSLENVNVVYMVPEALIIPAQEKLREYPENMRANLKVGCQSVFRNNIKAGENFGAFTANMPAASAYQMGCRWTIIGHSEERHDKQEIIGAFQPDWNQSDVLRERCAVAVDSLINREVLSALEQGMDVLLCIGETAEERGRGNFEEQRRRTQNVLYGQLKRGLCGGIDYLPNRKIVIGYEPIWAIGPGKTPPGREYIAQISKFIKDTVKEIYGFNVPVVYGGGLKEENAAMISSIETIDGGLVALTRFSGEIGFYVKDLKKIISQYIR